MKIRRGFVSNSSSSSFVVSAKDEASLVVTVTLQIDLTKYERDYNACDVLRSVAELEAYADHSYDPESFRETSYYADAKAALEAGRVVFFGELDYHGDAFEKAAHNTVGELRTLLAGNPAVEVISFQND